MNEPATNVDRLVAEGMKEAGRALLLEGVGPGAARASRTLLEVVGGLEARVWLAGPEGAGAEGWRAGGEPDTALGRFLERAAVGGLMALWSRQGREARPEVVELDAAASREAAELEASGAAAVLVVPLLGTSRVLGALGVALRGTAVEADRLEAARLVGELTGIGLDVVERAQAARETEGRLRRFLQQLPDPALLLDRTGVVRDVSDTISELAGITAEALLGRSIEFLALEEDRPAVREALRHALEKGAFRGTFGVAGRRRGERREIELNIRRFSERRLLAVARDVTRRVRREHNLRVMLEQTTSLMTAGTPDELWERLARAVKALLPRATYVWVYRGTDRGVRMEWSSRPDAPRWEFTMRGWGRNVVGLLRQEDGGGEFLKRYGSNEAMARQQLNALLSGRGTPLLLNRPAEQLAVFLGERELNAILQFWGDAPPGQLIHCPVVVNGALEFLLVVDAPPGERPFDHGDAAFAWQLTNLAHQALGRIEGFEVARRQLAEVETFREAVRQVGEVSGGEELVEALLRRAAWAVGADGGCLMLADGGGWRCAWRYGAGCPPAGALVQLPPLPESSAGGLRPLYLDDTAKDRAWRNVAGRDAASVAAVPLVAMGRPLGVLLLATGTARSYDAADREMLEFFADELALVVAQEQLARKASRASAALGAVLEAVDRGVVLADGDGRLVRANRAALAVLGATASSGAGGSVLELFPAGQRSVLAEHLAAALEGRDGGTCRLETDTGTVRADVRPLAGGGCLVVLRDGEEPGRPESEPGEPEPPRARDEDPGPGDAAEAWSRVEEAAGRLNDLLTALLGRVELMETAGEAAGALANLAREAGAAGSELRRVLGEARPPADPSDPGVG